MVYCKLKSQDGHKLKYSVGSIYNDLSGELLFDSKELSYEIIKQPDKGEIYPLFIGKMLRRYIPKFQSGIIPNTMSYEI